MTKNVTLRMPKLLDLDQLLLWENNLKNSLFSDNPIFYTKEQIEEFLTSDQDIFLNLQMRFMIDSSGSAVGCIDLFEYDMVNPALELTMSYLNKSTQPTGKPLLSIINLICRSKNIS